MTLSRHTGVAAHIALGVIWGTNFVFIELASPYISAAQTMLLRMGFGVIPILAFALVTRSMAWRHLRHIHHLTI